MFRVGNEIITYGAIIMCIAVIVFIIAIMLPEKDSGEEKKRIIRLNHVLIMVSAGLMLAAFLI